MYYHVNTLILLFSFCKTLLKVLPLCQCVILLNLFVHLCENRQFFNFVNSLNRIFVSVVLYEGLRSRLHLAAPAPSYRVILAAPATAINQKDKRSK